MSLVAYSCSSSLELERAHDQLVSRLSEPDPRDVRDCTSTEHTTYFIYAFDSAYDAEPVPQPDTYEPGPDATDPESYHSDPSSDPDESVALNEADSDPKRADPLLSIYETS